MHYNFRLVGRILDVICIYVYACASMQKQGRCININKYFSIISPLVNSLLEKEQKNFKNCCSVPSC